MNRRRKGLALLPRLAPACAAFAGRGAVVVSAPVVVAASGAALLRANAGNGPAQAGGGKIIRFPGAFFSP